MITAGFVSGYRGSPLGGLDKAFLNAKNVLDSNDIKFIPGVNEDLAATSIWGTQQLNLFDQSKYHGVFSLWYGKSPGVDRCGDVFKHMSFQVLVDTVVFYLLQVMITVHILQLFQTKVIIYLQHR